MSTPSFSAPLHSSSPKRQYPPPQLAEETTFGVGDEVECRVPGRHGWHKAVITLAEMKPAQSAFAYIYSAKREDGVVLSGLKAGNLRTRSVSSQVPTNSFSPKTRVGDGRPAIQKISQNSSKTRDREQKTTSTIPQNTVSPTQADAASISDVTPPIPPPQRTANVPAAVRALLHFAASRGVDCCTWFAPDGGWPVARREDTSTGSVLSSRSGGSSGGDSASAPPPPESARGARVVSAQVFREKLTHLGLGLAVGRPMGEQMAIERGLATEALEQTVAAVSVEGGGVDIDWLLASAAPAAWQGTQAATTVTFLPTPPADGSAPSDQKEEVRAAVGSSRVSEPATSSDSSSRGKSCGGESSHGAILMAPVPSPDGSPSEDTHVKGLKHHHHDQHQHRHQQQQRPKPRERIGETRSTSPRISQQKPWQQRPEPAKEKREARRPRAPSSSSSQQQHQQHQQQHQQQGVTAAGASHGVDEGLFWAQAEEEVERRLRSLWRHHPDSFHALRNSFAPLSSETRLLLLSADIGDEFEGQEAEEGWPVAGSQHLLFSARATASSMERERQQKAAVAAAAAARATAGAHATSAIRKTVEGGRRFKTLGAGASRRRVVTRAVLSEALHACGVKWPPHLTDALLRCVASSAPTTTTATAVAASSSPPSSSWLPATNARGAEGAKGGGRGGFVGLTGGHEEEGQSTTRRSVPGSALHRFLLSVQLSHAVGWDEWFTLKQSRHASMHKQMIQEFASVIAGRHSTLLEHEQQQQQKEKKGDRERKLTAWVELCGRLEQLPVSVARALSGGGAEKEASGEEQEEEDEEAENALTSLLEQEAEAMTHEWLESAEARKDVSNRMVSMIEERRLATESSSSPNASNEKAVSLFQCYQRYLANCRKLEKKLVAQGMGESGGSGEAPTFGTWLKKFADPEGDVLRACTEDAFRDHSQALLASDSEPLLVVPVDAAPKGWRGLGEVSRGRVVSGGHDHGGDQDNEEAYSEEEEEEEEGGGGGDVPDEMDPAEAEATAPAAPAGGQKGEDNDSNGSGGDHDSGGGPPRGGGASSAVVRFRPYTFTKRLLTLFFQETCGHGSGGSGGQRGASGACSFVEWLEERGRRRSETDEVVQHWAKRKGRVAAARAAGGECSAVLCLDAGGMEAQSGGAAATLDSVLRDLLLRSQETPHSSALLRPPPPPHPAAPNGEAAAAAAAPFPVVPSALAAIGDYSAFTSTRRGVEFKKLLTALTQEPEVKEVPLPHSAKAGGGGEAEAQQQRAKEEEEEAELQSNNRAVLKRGLTELLRPHFCGNPSRQQPMATAVRKRVPVRCLRLPPTVAATVPRLKGKQQRGQRRRSFSGGVASAAAGGTRLEETEEDDAAFLYRVLVPASKRGPTRSGEAKAEVEVSVVSGGLKRWYRAKVLKASWPSTQHLHHEEEAEEEESATAKRRPQRPRAQHHEQESLGGRGGNGNGGGGEDANDDDEEDYSEDVSSTAGSASGADGGGVRGGEGGGGGEENESSAGNSESPTASVPQEEEEEEEERIASEAPEKSKTKKKMKKMKMKKRRSTSSFEGNREGRRGLAPQFYDVEFTRESCEARLDACVASVLHKCSRTGEPFKVTREENGGVQVEFGEVDEESGLQGQHRVLDAIADQYMEDVDGLKEIGWVGPAPTPGTELMPGYRRTHAYLVPKRVLDRVLSSTIASALADKDLSRDQSKAARDLLNPSFDFGAAKTCRAQDHAQILGLSRSTLKTTLQHELTEATGGLFDSEHRQVALAQQMAQDRDSNAGKKFKEWAASKALEKRRQKALELKQARKQAEDARAAAEARDKGVKKWRALAAKGLYSSYKGGEVKARVSTKERLIQKAAWCFEPPTPTDDLG